VQLSDFNGEFIITGLEPGYLKLQVSFIGYKPVFSDEALVSSNNIPFIEIKLEPSEVNS